MKIAIVDGYSTGSLLVKKLRQRGVECLHVRSQEVPPARLLPSFVPEDYAADLGWFPDPADAVRALKEAGVDRVVAGTECGVVLADTLAHELGLPGNEFDGVEARRDKYAMAERLAAAGLAAPVGFSTTEPAAAVAWFHAAGGGTAVVKPAASAGTDNVHVCTTAEQVRAACTAVMTSNDYFGNPNPSAVIQKFLVGTEYIVNTVAVDGVQKVSDVWISAKTPGPTGAPLYDHQQPLPVTAPHVAGLVDYVTRAVTALGITNGAAHSEVMLTADGPVLIETGARLMGAMLPDVIERHSGTSHVELLALALTDPSAFHAFRDREVRWNGYVRNIWLINRTAGPATAWHDRFAALPAFDRLVTGVRAGDPVRRTVDMASSPGYVSLTAGTEAALDRDQAAIRAMEAAGLYVDEANVDEAYADEANAGGACADGERAGGERVGGA
ncbi:ATP-grasp domain-containing protein [Streptomyces bambusae]|uniref:ATP-grasp domain-containing protein n=1 Tax=Streptomyces bambusae TaxID=1550616 RepID=UPI001CFDAA69|nr:ATP-grasp domain-containing protein [Streptomyces bambusae]MCB5166105.1 ATP-grasp domain-containing protein [Streptomyces bambusae]